VKREGKRESLPSLFAFERVDSEALRAVPQMEALTMYDSWKTEAPTSDEPAEWGDDEPLYGGPVPDFDGMLDEALRLEMAL